VVRGRGNCAVEGDLLGAVGVEEPGGDVDGTVDE
jgi:hypothetical protein